LLLLLLLFFFFFQRLQTFLPRMALQAADAQPGQIFTSKEINIGKILRPPAQHSWKALLGSGSRHRHGGSQAALKNT
jgi:hypothetical protein